LRDNFLNHFTLERHLANLAGAIQELESPAPPLTPPAPPVSPPPPPIPA
jgi:hypothetical protein